MSTPSVAELRAATQPQGLLDRPGAEHWAGRLYMRRLSPYLTRALVPTGLSPNALTGLMIPCGLLAAGCLTLPGIGGAIGALLLAQVQLLLDCSDGELARWRQRVSAVGVYLDQIAHYTTEAALAIALGIRADGGWDSLGGWTSLGLVVAVLILLLKAETHLTAIARARVGQGAPDLSETAAGAGSRLREGARLLPMFRPFQAIEATLLALAAAIGDVFVGDLQVTKGLVLALLGVGVVAVLGHLAAVLRSSALKGDPGPQ